MISATVPASRDADGSFEADQSLLLQAALEDLEHLRDIAPDESNVVYQLAMLYRHMGKSVQSALQLATARDLSPQSMSRIKKLVETTREEDEQMEE
jgi:anaphase-promoting complex subunit 3